EGSYYLKVETMNHIRNQRAILTSPEIVQQDTHCFSFDYYLEGSGVVTDSNGSAPLDALPTSSGRLSVYVRNGDTKTLLQPVWESAEIGASTEGWVKVQLALNPRAYQVSFEATVLQDIPGVVAVDNIVVSSAPCDSTPHFLRVGNKEVNMGQNISLQCLLWGHNGPNQRIVMQKSTGESIVPSYRKVYDDHLSVVFNFTRVSLEDSGNYRCLSQKPTQVGVSNYAKLSVREPPRPTRGPKISEPGSTSFVIQLNIDDYSGDGPIVQTILKYRPVHGLWSDVHHITNADYRLWHLKPDTEYEVAVTLVRPGIGGTGPPGPELRRKTKCGKPLQKLQNVMPTPLGSDRIQVDWDVPDFSVVQCHFYEFNVKYRVYDEDHPGGVYEEINTQQEPMATIVGLNTFTRYSIKVSLVTSGGSIETGEYVIRTGEGVPSVVPPDSFVTTFINETSIALQWAQPLSPNGVLDGYEVSYRGIRSHDPTFQAQNDNGYIQEKGDKTNLVLTGLHPGTRFAISIRAHTKAGFSNGTEIVASTDIAAPRMPQYPDPLDPTNKTITPTTIEILLKPADTNGAPITNYYIIIEERQAVVAVTDDNPAACMAEPITYEDAKRANRSAYAGAKFDPSELTQERKFVVGGESSTDGFTNPPLDPNKDYKIYVRAESGVGRDVKVNCVLVALKGGRSKHLHKTEVVNPFEVRMMMSEVNSPGHTLLPTNQTQEGSLDRRALMPDVVGYEHQGTFILFLLLYIIFMLAENKALIIILFLCFIAQETDIDHFWSFLILTSAHIYQSHWKSNICAITHLFANYLKNTLFCALNTETIQILKKNYSIESNYMEKASENGASYPAAPSTDERFALRVDDFHVHVSQMKATGGYGFREEFASFPDGPTAPWTVAEMPQNRVKNRYGNIMSYDHSRVVLEPLAGHEEEYESDYINASYVNGYKKPGISNIIVMVTNLVELGKRKCHKYWPDERDTYGSIQVSLSNVENMADCSIRSFVIQQTDGYDVREVKQFHFTSWPDHGVPSHPTNLLSFVRKVKAYDPQGQGPTVVHCSAGSGRTGCFMVIDMMLDMARDEEIVDIYNTVKDLRSRRVNMVQTEEQYIFIHEAVLEALLCGETSVAANELVQHYDDLITVDPQTHFAPIQEEFESFSERNAFLLTQMPLPNTVIDIWRLIYDHNCSSIVMMNDITEHDTCRQYWPDKGSAIYGSFTVELLTKDDEVDVITRLFKLQNISRVGDGYRLVQQFQLTNWPAPQPVPYSRNSVLRVIQLITKWQSECSVNHEQGRTLVHCVAGAGRSGTFVACYNMCEQLRDEYNVDVFNIVQRLRNIRPQLVETLVSVFLSF
uniref:protein-tyrosine-phosphatase n=1 Tax=Ciona savignyi TaxID=51511 RepID=H2Y4Y0_CIOSA